jgi:hypothetical protein
LGWNDVHARNVRELELVEHLIGYGRLVLTRQPQEDSPRALAFVRMAAMTKSFKSSRLIPIAVSGWINQQL